MTRPGPPAPVALICYARPDHLAATLEALAANPLAAETAVFAFSDGPKSAAAEPGVAAVRGVLRAFAASGRFGAFHVTEREANLGLFNSVTSAATELLAGHDRVIVLEDDLAVSPRFLDYMNDALEQYRGDPRIGSVAGYSPLRTLPAGHGAVYTLPRASSHGWGTWRDRWAEIRWDETIDIARLARDRKARRELDWCGADIFDRLRRQVLVGAESWATIFVHWQWKTGRLTVYPAANLIRQLGHDDSGVHMSGGKAFAGDYSEAPVIVPAEAPPPDPRIARAFRALFRGGLSTQLGRALRTNGLEPVDRLLRRFAR